MSNTSDNNAEASASGLTTHTHTSWECAICGKRCASKAGLTLHSRIHPGVPSINLASTPTTNFDFSCNLCGFGCPTQRGLTQHRRHKHPDAHNETKLKSLKSVRGVWSPEEDMLLMRLADQHHSRFALKKELYLELQRHLPKRSTESIKKRLQGLNWQPPTDATNVPSDTELCTADAPPGQEQRNNEPVQDSNQDRTSLEEACLLMANASKPTWDTPAEQLPITTPVRSNPDDTFVASRNDETSEDGSIISSAQKQLLLETACLLLANTSKPKWDSPALLMIAEHLRDGKMTVAEARERLTEHAVQVFPHTYKVSRSRTSNAKAYTNRKQRRRAQYARVQTLFHHSVKDAADTVLRGAWKNEQSSQMENTEEFREYWIGKLTASPHADHRPPRSVHPEVGGTCLPITVQEVTEALKKMRGSAPGLDRLKPEQLLRYNKSLIAGYLNLILAVAFVPPQLNAARVTFIPKCDDPAAPGDYRPITVASVLIRCLHKILAHRWSEIFNLGGKHFAFLKRDGCAEACAVLHAVLRDAHSRSQPLALASLDLSKAFDSISHDSIIRSARAFGAPSLLVDYLCSVYATASSQLPDGTVVCPKRGVRQGDPLSPLLFLMAMDELLELADPTICLRMEPGPIDAIAYADDLVVFAEGPDQLKTKLEKVVVAAGLSGLTVNSSKSFVLKILACKKRKFVAYDPEPMTVCESVFNALGPSDDFKYLGVSFTARGKASVNPRTLLVDMLSNISAAPLKPQQRLRILRCHAIPKMMHTLCLGVVHKKTLKSLDQLCRAHVRKWLRLPPDTSVAYFHASFKAGGLAIPHLSTSIPLQRKNRLEKLSSSPFPLLKWTASADSTAASRKLEEATLVVRNRVITSNQEAAEMWREELKESLDGKHLKFLSECPQSSSWLSQNGRMFGRLFLRATQLRLGLLSTKARSSRGGRTSGDVTCSRGCGAVDSLSHILQTCPVTHDSRCRRHNEVCKLLFKKLKRSNSTVFYEPRIILREGFCKPDLVLVKDSCAIVHEVAVCDPTRIPMAWENKRSRYDTTEINDAIRRHLKNLGENVSTVRHVPTIVSYNGLIYGKSSQALLQEGLTETDVSDLCVEVIRGSLKTYDFHRRGN